ncbi:MAG: YgiQ family radical SAM protein [Sphaerochaetaceae bacterium]|nr:YgiQ family radical SAM protein [Sphaerochaetaceae bacterium]
MNEKSALFLPMTKEDMTSRGWSSIDILFISADAYVDHPSFALALLGRLLEKEGYKVGIVAQPDWNNPSSIDVFGRPNLCAMISGGNIDSMVSHYTSTKKKRSGDYYSPGGKSGYRPDRPTIVYSNMVHQVYKNLPIIIGGIEASLRRFSHYDYWQDLVKKPLILDAKANLLVYGMGEIQILEIAKRLKNGEPVTSLTNIQGTVYSIGEKDRHILEKGPFEVVEMPSYEEVSQRDKVSNKPLKEGQISYAKAYNIYLQHVNPYEKKCLIQRCNGRIIVQNPPARPLTTEEFDSLYELPYTRKWHPSYNKEGGIPALKEVQFSITSNRGCFGGCSFCAITTHQGRIIQTRSKDSLVKEAKSFLNHEDFKGYIHDLGGPTANFQCVACKKQETQGPCSHRQCLYPKPCPNIKDSHDLYLEKLEALRNIPGIKKVFIRSGIRFDYLMLCTTKETRERFMKALVQNHVSGQLKVAPEHISSQVLSAMGKCPVEVYDLFKKAYLEENKKQGKKQFLIPYLIAAHPGSTLDDAIDLALYMKKSGFVPDQVQEFYPTVDTVSTTMYYTGLDPRPGENFKEIHIPRGREANLQRALLQFNKKENRSLVLEALEKAGKRNLARILLD